MRPGSSRQPCTIELLVVQILAAAIRGAYVGAEDRRGGRARVVKSIICALCLPRLFCMRLTTNSGSARAGEWLFRLGPARSSCGRGRRRKNE